MESGRRRPHVPSGCPRAKMGQGIQGVFLVPRFPLTDCRTLEGPLTAPASSPGDQSPGASRLCFFLLFWLLLCFVFLLFSFFSPPPSPFLVLYSQAPPGL